MRFFPLLDYQDWLLGVFLGVVLAMLIYLGFRSYGYSRERSDERARQEFDYPDGIKAKNFPTPPHILFLYIGFIAWAVFYIIFVGILYGPI